MNNTNQAGAAVNQLGYRNKDKKITVFSSAVSAFHLMDDASGVIVWTGATNPIIDDASSGQSLSRGDFSDWTKPGTYRIRGEDGSLSLPFVISDSVYIEAHQALLKAFYYFRCGMQLDERYAGPWTHEACHLTPAIVFGDEKRRVEASGGWHDAGDYGKYVGPGAKAVTDLMMAYDRYPKAFSEPVLLPETDREMPDVLHECRYELEWMLKMQDAKSGGVFHKLTTLQFPAIDIMPEEDASELYLSPISSTATGCFAGAMAMAARIYAPFDTGFAERCLQAAEMAWDWLDIHPEFPGFRNPPEIGTGEYGDDHDADERYWAAAELYRTTGESRYHQAFQAMATDSFDKNELGWSNMGGYGTVTYLLSEREKEPALAAELKKGLLRYAESLARVSAQDGYGLSLRSDQYIWGSNMLVMNQAMLLLIADRLEGTHSYESYAVEHVHYLLGLNSLGISYVSGFGAKPILHPHHRPSEGDGVDVPVPGLVSGGPNSRLQDNCAREHLQGKPPAACFVDIVDSYSTNEVAVYWNSPAVFVLSHFVSN